MPSSSERTSASTASDAGPRNLAMNRAAKFISDGRLHRQRQPFSIRRVEVHNRGQGSAEVRRCRLHPDRVDVRADQVAVPEVDTGGRHRPGDHTGGLAVEVLVVGASSRAVGEHQGGLSAASRPAASLRVVGWGGRDVPQVDEVELGDVDAELHGGRAEEERKVSFPKTLLPFLAVFRRNLSSVLARFESALKVHESPIALHEVVIHLGRKLAFFKQTGAVDRAILAIAGQPSQRIGIELIARTAAVAVASNLLDNAVALESEEAGIG